MAKYQGWTNYETFTVAVVLKNDRVWSDKIKAKGEELYAQDDTPLRLADWLRKIAQDRAPLDGSQDADTKCGGPMVYSTLLEHALGSVNWLEIAQDFLKQEE